MAEGDISSKARTTVEKIGRSTCAGVEELGHGGSLLGECLFWLVMGPKRKQPVRFNAVIVQMVDVGIGAIPIVAVLTATIGVMLAIQGIYTLRVFGAESKVTIGVAYSMVREFSPLITGILIAGRSGSALAARIGIMKINQELDALKVMGVEPVRFMVVPALVAMLIMLPALTFFGDMVGLLAAGLYISADLGISLSAYGDDLRSILSTNDVWHGLGKSAIFAVLVTVVGVVNGAAVSGGAEGVGRYTTRSVVHAISAIVVTDMLFAFMVTR
ncbi:ABC transporter permease [Magnetospira sp. QH-2]|uniref:MlaE family ABC transporter permease n=1 Tax=Magnetospira sp. (strain QH-2) TaxID=1288970 RepID=UPI0003E80C45|nr:ABC transporter permease [Magnetospira sp. QH-2]CCQ74972.1 conserved protein of unknown function(similar to ABC-type transport system protein) [Magnetospira sp. QH-2]